MLKFKQTLPLKGAFWYVLAYFFFTLGASIITPIFPLYIKNFVGGNEAFVGYVYSFIGAILILGALMAGKLLKKFEKKPLLITSLLIVFLANYAFMVIQNLTQLLVVLFFRTAAIMTTVIIIGLYIRGSVKRSALGRAEGFFFVFLNIAFVIGPLLGGPLAESFNFNFVFGIASLFPLIALFFTIYKIKKDGNVDQDGHNLLNNITQYFTKKNLILLYFVSFGLAVWWNLIYIYLPLYMKDVGMTEAIIGSVLFLVALPLIFLEFPAGKLADKFGEKQFFIVGYFILFIFSFIAFFVSNNYWYLALFIIASAGAGLFEPLRESYFFKKTSKRDSTRFYPIYTTAVDIGYFISPIALSSILFYTNFKSMFLAGSLFMLLFMVLASLMDNTKK